MSHDAILTIFSTSVDSVCVLVVKIGNSENAILMLRPKKN